MTILLSLALGAYLSQRVGVCRDGEIAALSVEWLRIWEDAISSFELFKSICGWTMALGEWTRAYVDCVVMPWIRQFGDDDDLDQTDLDELLEQQA